jgi:hypothetical protein
VAVDANHGGSGPTDRVWPIQVGCDKHARPALKDQALDDVTIAPDDAEDLGLKRARLLWRPPERSLEPITHGIESSLPAREGLGWRLRPRSPSSLTLDE